MTPFDGLIVNYSKGQDVLGIADDCVLPIEGN